MDEMKAIKIGAITLVCLLVLLFALPFKIISAGHRGVVFHAFDGIEQRVMGEGINFKIPLIERVTVFEVRTQKDSVQASAASKDLQIVTTDVAVNYHIDPSKVQLLYQQVGSEYKDRVIMPAVQEAIKASTAQYTAEELITKRTELSSEVYRGLNERLGKFYIMLDALAITNLDFTDEFNTAIEKKVTAEQNALAAKNKLEQVKFEAQQSIEIKKAEAEGLKAQKEQITSDLIELRRVEVQMALANVQLKMAERWDGKMPVNYMTMGSVTPLLQMPNVMTTPTTDTK